MTDAQRAIGILGGTFDPIHFGHLRIALELQQELGLAAVRMLPCAQPPHRGQPGASGEQRLQMLQLALQGEPALQIDTREYHRSGPSYTVDTLRSLRAELGEDQPLCLIMGSDAFAGLPSWHQWQQLFELAHIVIAHRPGWIRQGTQLGDLDISARFIAQPQALHQQPAGWILPWSVSQLEISATAIRQWVRQGKSVRYLLPEAVREYIEVTRLYR
ncbi:MAG: nicotinate-nucleotide adenylyltransferase [Gammaproteobacteria bacterium]|nr:nicotinate-nucleotide adenylyltransferase [Gammaproteobacteria bacterium]